MLRPELVPLGLATRSISRRIYPDELQCTPERLIGIAHVVAALAPLYSASVDGGNVRRLSQEELLAGRFGDAGTALRFMDGRSPIELVAVAQSSVEEVAQLLGRAVQERGTVLQCGPQDTQAVN